MTRCCLSTLTVLPVSFSSTADADDFKRERRKGESYDMRNKPKDALESKSPPKLAVRFDESRIEQRVRLQCQSYRQTNDSRSGLPENHNGK